MLKGYGDNPGGRLRGGQFVSVTIALPPPPDVVEIPMNAVVDDGKQCVVFIQPDANEPNYTIRRVLVTHRFDKTAFVRSRLTAAEQKLKPEEKEVGVRVSEPLRPGERVLTAGVLELKKELEDKEATDAEKQQHAAAKSKAAEAQLAGCHPVVPAVESLARALGVA